MSQYNAIGIVFENPLDLREDSLFARREQRLEVVVFGPLVSQIVGIPAKRVQKAQRVVFERRLDLPIGVRVRLSGYCQWEQPEPEEKHSRAPEKLGESPRPRNAESTI